MSKQKTEMLPQGPDPSAGAQTEAAGAYVLRNLGRPDNLLAVQARYLWDHHYRVNVLVGESAGSVTIAHSYFLVMDNDGSCLSSNPAITREYASKKAVATPQP